MHRPGLHRCRPRCSAPARALGTPGRRSSPGPIGSWATWRARWVSPPSACQLVSVHWGSELLEWPTSEQRRAARWLIAQGADLIVGHHPHVVRPAECLAGKPGFYSLGNHVFDRRARPCCWPWNGTRRPWTWRTTRAPIRGLPAGTDPPLAWERARLAACSTPHSGRTTAGSCAPCTVATPFWCRTPRGHAPGSRPIAGTASASRAGTMQPRSHAQDAAGRSVQYPARPTGDQNPPSTAASTQFP